MSVFIVTAVTGAAWYFSSQIIYPKKWGCPKEHFLYCGDPSELNLAFEDIKFSSAGEAEISAWYIPSGKSKKAVIMLHGHGATRNEAMRWVSSLNKAGFSLLLMDFRNHGKSTPGPISMGFHEKKDITAAVDYLIAEKKIESIGIFGVSMGSAAGIAGMALDKRIKAGGFEAGFAHFADLLADIAKRDFGLPRYPLIPIVVKFFELRTGADASKMNACEWVKEISPRPVLIMHCEGDNYIPFSHGRRIFEAAGEPKEFWNSPCSRHAQAWQGNTAKAEALVTGFYKKYL